MARRSAVSAPVAALVLVAATTLPLTAPAASAEQYPAAEGFDLAGSDPEAVAVAERVMAAMGGYDAWSSTRYLCWNFFGRRTHVWDRWSGDLRFEQGDLLVLMNINDKQGEAWRGGAAITDPEELVKVLDNGYKAWVNDSYWLFMPYKLKDSGVTLKLKGEGQLADGRPADVLQLTFEGVGVTPENKYDVYVARDTGLVEQWSYYPRAELAEPAFTTPWADWQRHGRILLSGDRGELRGNPARLTDIHVFDQLPRTLFESPEPVDLAAFADAGSE